MIGVIVSLLVSNDKKFTDSPTIPLPTIYPTKTLLSPTPTVINRSKLNTLLPIKQDDFSIEYLVTSDTFVITVTKSPYEENKLKAEDWLLSHGINDLSTERILYNRSLFVE
jgi:hypothetical protein